MLGAPDPLYIAARRVLLDAIGALSGHIDAIVLVGAQAVYIHAGEADLAVAPFTTDGDLAIDPRVLGSNPLLEVALDAANFRQADGEAGVWETSVYVEGVPTVVSVDLLVPDTLSGPGRRSARIPPHAKTAARKVSGLEASLVDNDMRTISALETDDNRHFKLAVAGPSALLVAKVHKILDRMGTPDRLRDKDALDIYRLLKAMPTDDLVNRFGTLLADELSRPVTERTITELSRLFGSPNAIGTQMAVRAAGRLESEATLSASLVVLAGDLIAGLNDV